METQTTLAQIKNSLKDIQWRWIFGATFAVLGTIQIVMFLIISIYVARNSAAGNTLSFEEISQFSETLGALIRKIRKQESSENNPWLAVMARVWAAVVGGMLALFVFRAIGVLYAIDAVAGMLNFVLPI